MRTRRLLIPELVQTSAVDCGPACLKSLLEGFGISVSYDRLREACQTDVDGTSIDAIEQVAIDLGLEAEQIMLPVDHLLLPEAKTFPAIVVVRLPNSLTHFVVVWRQHGGLLQVMDPSQGRVWPSAKKFLSQVHLHTHAVPAADWREWTGSDDFINALRRRGERVWAPNWTISRLIKSALADPGWRSIAALDAAIRMIGPMVGSGGLHGGQEIGRILEGFVERAHSAESPFHVIPPLYWSVLPAVAEPGSEERLVFRGAVLIRVRGRRAAAPQPKIPDAENSRAGSATQRVKQAPVAALRQLIGFLKQDGLLAPAGLVAALAVAAGGLVVEALLYRTFLDLTGVLGLTQQRLLAFTIVIAFLAVLLGLDLLTGGGVMRVGRRLEVGLRMHLLRRMPNLPDRYFGSRLVSDMAERSHAIHEIRMLPMMGGQLINSLLGLALTTAGIIWLDPQTAPLAIASALFAVLLPLVIQPMLSERDLRFRTHSGGLCRFYFDALRGLVPVRAHGAEDAVRCEHEYLLVNWARSGLTLQRAAVALDGVGSLLGFGLTALLLLGHIGRNADSTVGLLLVYWALSIFVLGEQVAQVAVMYPRQRNLSTRLLEPLAAVEETATSASQAAVPDDLDSGSPRGGVSIEFEDVSIRASGQTIFQGANLKIDPGSHVCIVGRSGAGKSSLVSLLLGWNNAADGRVLVDGVPLDEARLEWLRRRTAWVDPAIQVWNRSLLDNLKYGLPPEGGAPPVAKIIDQADLLSLLEKLPEGLQTPLGEGGALVSGGEGQRVRLGRAMLRQEPRLVILDEPFTALDRERRRELLKRARELWRQATLLCITHDVDESLEFDRVIVVAQGTVVEDGSPAALAAQSSSTYRGLLDSEQEVRSNTWGDHAWRRMRLENGRMIESTEKPKHEEPTRKDVLAGVAVRRSAGSFGPAGVDTDKIQ